MVNAAIFAMNDKNQPIKIYGVISIERQNDSLIGSFLTSEYFNKNRIISLFLEDLSDKEFNNLIIGDKFVELRIKNKTLSGKIIGGSDLTRILRSQGKKIRPQQQISILLDEKLDEITTDEIEGKRAEIMVDNT